MHAWVIGLGDLDEGIMRASGLSYREPHCIVQEEIGKTDCTCPASASMLVTLALTAALAKNKGQRSPCDRI
jgi:hypothetical protein